VELIAVSKVTIRSIWQKSAFDCLRFGIFPPHICESCGATYPHRHESFSALQSTSIPLTDVENCIQIDPQLATLSFLKMVKIDHKSGSEFGALLWRHLTPQRKTAI